MTTTAATLVICHTGSRGARAATLIAVPGRRRRGLGDPALLRCGLLGMHCVKRVRAGGITCVLLVFMRVCVCVCVCV